MGDNTAGIALLKQAVQLGQTFSDAAKTHETVALAAHICVTKADQSALDDKSAPLKAMLAAVSGMVGNASLNSAKADAAKKKTALGDDQLPHASSPIIAVSAKGGLSVTAGQALQMSNGETIALMSGADTQFVSGGQLRLQTLQAIGVLGGAIKAGENNIGVQMIAAKDAIDIQAQAGELKVQARDEAGIISASAGVDWAAAQSISLSTAGGANITIDGGISHAYPESARPAPSAVYEILRFGRILNGPNEVLAPADCPHWRRVQGNTQVGWVNLNAAGVHKFSDADFPGWKGWKLVDDDSDDDSRAESALLQAVIEDASNADGSLSREELEQRMGLPEVRTALSRCICKFPSEWNRDSIDARWGWLQSDPDYGVTGEDWTKLRAHIAALTVPAAALPAALVGAHWHFQPQAFITHFRKCQWLSADEFKQLVPRHAMRRHAGTYLWEAVQTNLASPTSVVASQRVGLNRMTRKYGINSPLRLASFYGNAIQETQWLGVLSEGSGSTLWYAPWYGRGFLQLTNPENFINYWRFRGRQVPDTLKNALSQAYSAIASQPVAQRSNATLSDAHFPQLTAPMRGWRDEVKGVAMANSTDSGYAPSDSAGFYWAKLRGVLCRRRPCSVPNVGDNEPGSQGILSQPEFLARFGCCQSSRCHQQSIFHSPEWL